MAYDFEQGIADRLEQGTLENLAPDACFNFTCQDACMGRCCNNITILLDPWDIEEMARFLELPGQDFFQRHCGMELNKNLGWPMVWLDGAKTGNCSFMLPDGKCSIYAARSRNCRTYPLGRAVRFTRGDENGEAAMEERIFLVDQMDFCLGRRSQQQWTVQQWLEDAQAAAYYEMSDQYAHLMDYAVRVLKTPQWVNQGVVKMMMPFLYAPELLRKKMGSRLGEMTHAEFHRRRMLALRLVLTDMAAGLGFGPGRQAAAQQQGSLLERMQFVLEGGQK